jgi:hypothetical protein
LRFAAINNKNYKAMELQLIESKELKSLHEKIESLTTAIRERKTEVDFSKDFINTKDFKRIFGLSLVSQWKMRKAGKLPYRTAGRTVLYRLSEVEEALKS